MKHARIFPVLAAVCVLAVLFASCGGGDGSTPPANTGTNSSTGTGTTLDLTGTWNFYFTNIPGRSGEYGPMAGTLVQTGTTLEITFPSPINSVSGTINGDQVAFSMTLLTLDMDATGTATADSMNGGWTAGTDTGTWRATKQ